MSFPVTHNSVTEHQGSVTAQKKGHTHAEAVKQVFIRHQHRLRSQIWKSAVISIIKYV